MVASLVAAMVAALCYGVAAVLQAMAVREASLRPAGSGPAGVDPGLVVRMLRQWRFIASLGLDLIGFLSQLVALRQLPLFAVQAMIAANLAVTAVGGENTIAVRCDGGGRTHFIVDLYGYVPSAA